MTFEEIFKYRNINGDIYLCDVRKFLGFEINLKQAEKIWEKLNEIKDKWPKK